MFFPTVRKGFHVYDIPLLIKCGSTIEEALYIEAVKAIPVLFLEEYPWGAEIHKGTVWIDRIEHERVFQHVRQGFAHSRNFVDSAISKLDFTIDTQRRCLSLPHHIFCDMMEQNAFISIHSTHIAWFVCNWLNPIASVFQTIQSFTRDSNKTNMVLHELLRVRPSRFISMQNRASSSDVENAFTHQFLDNLVNFDAEAKGLFEQQIRFVIRLSEAEELRRLFLMRLNDASAQACQLP